MNDKIKEVVSFWGDHMPMMVMEEASELIMAISKLERDPKSSSRKQDLIDEIGDMIISINCLKELYNISDEDVELRIKTKLNKSYNS